MKVLSLFIFILFAVGSNSILSAQTVEAGPDRSICLGDEVQLMASDAMFYEWSPANGLSDVDASNPIANPNVTTTYFLNSVDLNGNPSIDTLTIFVISEITFDVGSNETICFGETISLGDSPELDVQYTWSPDLGISAIDVSNPDVNPSVTTVYSVIAQNGSCSFEDEVTITVNNINVDFDYILFPSCEKLEMQLVNKSDPASYQWNFWDGSSTSEVSPMLEVTPGEEIFVTLRELQSQCNFNKTVEIDLNELDSYINFSAENVLSPNGDGINDYMSIGLDGNLEECMEFVIYNRWGERIFVSTGGNSRWDGYTLAGQRAASGVYFYVVTIKGQVYNGSVQVF
ncbi:MAG: gliding motility-associated-like protein [Glaciecola sp.]